MENLKQENNLEVEPIDKKKKFDKNIIYPILVIIIAVAIALFYWYRTNSIKQMVSGPQQSNKMCSDVNIVFFAGGNEDDSFASVVAGGAKAAEQDLGAKVEYIWSDWDSSKILSQLMDSIAKNPDAIAIMGHPGSKALSPLVNEAVRKGIIITSQNVDLQDIREKYSSKGFGYVGQSLYDSGLTVANGVVRKYNLENGGEAIVFGVNPNLNPSRYQRTKGEVDGLKNAKFVVHEVAMPLEVEKDASSMNAQKMISDAIAEYPNAKVIITDHGQLTASVATHLKNLEKKPGDYIVAGFDLSVKTVAAIRENYVGLVLDQQPYLQGYLPVLQACLTKKYGFAGLYIDTGIGLIDSSNVDLVAALAEKKIR